MDVFRGLVCLIAPLAEGCMIDVICHLLMAAPESTRSFSDRTVCSEQGRILSVEPLEHIHAALEDNIVSHLQHCQGQGKPSICTAVHASMPGMSIVFTTCQHAGIQAVFGACQ